MAVLEVADQVRKALFVDVAAVTIIAAVPVPYELALADLFRRQPSSAAVPLL